MGTHDNADFARSIFAAFNRSDLEAVIAMAADDVETVDFGLQRTYRGHAGLREFLTHARALAPDAEADFVDQLVSADGVTTECVFRGTNTGPLQMPDGGELPPSGKPFALPMCNVFQLRAGKIARFHTYADSMTMLTQLGVLPAPAAAQ